MLQQGAIYRTPGGQLVQARQERLFRRWHRYDVATDQPERDTLASALDRLNEARRELSVSLSRRDEDSAGHVISKRLKLFVL